MTRNTEEKRTCYHLKDTPNGLICAPALAAPKASNPAHIGHARGSHRQGIVTERVGCF